MRREEMGKRASFSSDQELGAYVYSVCREVVSATGSLAGQCIGINLTVPRSIQYLRSWIFGPRKLLSSATENE